MSQKYFWLGLMGIIVIFNLFGCAKKNPVGPFANDLPDVPNPTATPTQISVPGKATVILKTMIGSNPLTNISCSVKFSQQSVGTTNVTGPDGTSTFVMDAEGSYTASIPNQGDLVVSSLTGNCNRGQSTSVVFNAGGAWTSITPTTINYAFAGGRFPIKICWSKQANALNLTVHPAIINLPAGWSANFSDTSLVSDQISTLSLIVPPNSTTNVTNLTIQAIAASNAILINSDPIAVTRGWMQYANCKVVVQNGGRDYPGVDFIITDSAGTTYTGRSQAGGTTIQLNNVGSYTVHIPAQALVADNLQTGTIAQAQTLTNTFDVGYAHVQVKVFHNSYAYTSLPVQLTDANNNIYNGSTDSNGTYTFTLSTIGNYSITIPANVSYGILQSSKTGTVRQNQIATATLTGQNGSLFVSNGGYVYPFVGGTQTGTITYTPAGDVNYAFSLSANNIPGGSVSSTFNDTSLTSLDTVRRIIETVAAAATWTGTVSVTATKAGQNSFTVASNSWSIVQNWNIAVSVTDPVVMSEISDSENKYPYDRGNGCYYADYSGTIAYTVNSVNVPAGTKIQINLNYLMPASSNLYFGTITQDWASPFYINVDDANSHALVGYKRVWKNSYGIVIANRIDGNVAISGIIEKKIICNFYLQE